MIDVCAHNFIQLLILIFFLIHKKTFFFEFVDRFKSVNDWMETCFYDDFNV